MQDATVQSTPQMSQTPAATVAPSSYVAPAPQAQAPGTGTGTGTTGLSGGYELPTSGTSGSPQLPIKPYSVRPPIPTGGSSGEQSMGIGVQQGNERPEYTSSIPVPGSTLSDGDTIRTSELRTRGNSQATPASAPQTSSANQVYSANSSQTSSTLSVRQLGRNTGQIGMSPESRQVMDAFGVEAPAVLNQYALNLEEMLDSAVQWGNEAQGLIIGYEDFAVQEHQENLAYNEILTNPDVLSDYTLKYFGPEGPCPVYENEQQLETQGYIQQKDNILLQQTEQTSQHLHRPLHHNSQKISGVHLTTQCLVIHRMHGEC